MTLRYAVRQHLRQCKQTKCMYMLTRALLGGGGGGSFERPLRFFEDSENEKTGGAARRWASPTLPPTFSATFVKISTQCLGQVTRSSQVTQLQNNSNRATATMFQGKL